MAHRPLRGPAVPGEAPVPLATALQPQPLMTLHHQQRRLVSPEFSGLLRAAWASSSAIPPLDLSLVEARLVVVVAIVVVAIVVVIAIIVIIAIVVVAAIFLLSPCAPREATTRLTDGVALRALGPASAFRVFWAPRARRPPRDPRSRRPVRSARLAWPRRVRRGAPRGRRRRRRGRPTRPTTRRAHAERGAAQCSLRERAAAALLRRRNVGRAARRRRRAAGRRRRRGGLGGARRRRRG